MTSLLHVSTRVFGPPDQDPDSNGMESSGPSGEPRFKSWKDLGDFPITHFFQEFFVS